MQYPEPMQYSGPPGGQMDPTAVPSEAQYEQDSAVQQQPAVPQAYGDATEAPGQEYAPDDQEQAQVEPQPSADPQDPGYAMGPVDDTEINATLDTYGQWGEDPDYGRVWRPDATVVGVDFTPYESCGSWAWTDWGWSFNCDWNWGWLPFHYGRWNWMDGGYWGWVPGHEWGPGWVDWRHGGGYVGWRPTAPEFHDHRGQHPGPTFHDHRSGAHDSQWRFVSTNDFGRGHIRPHLYKDLAEGLRVTESVPRPPLRGTTQPVRVASTMGARLANPVWRQQHAPAGGWRQPVTAHQPGPRPQQQWGVVQRQGVQVPRQQVEVPRQQWTAPQQQGWRQPPQQQGWRQPPQQQGWRQPPQQGFNQPRPQVWSPPATQHPTWNRPAHAPPSRPYGGGSYPGGSGGYSRPAYTPRPTYTPPSRPSYSPPSHSWSAPSSGSYSGGHSSGGYSGGHSSGGYSGGSHSSGGGGHHR